MRMKRAVGIAGVLLAGWLCRAVVAQDAPLGVVERDVAVPMRDGIVLRADLWRPVGPGPFPTLVYRTPYGKAEVFVSYSIFRRAVERGYAIVAQDVRGRYASGGDYIAYRQEGHDGYDTIEWAASQSWSNGAVGTFGLSYPGAVQWLAAVESPPHLKAMVPAMTFASPSHFWYAGGVWDASWLRWTWNNIAPDLRQRAGVAGPKTGAEARAAWPLEGRHLQEVLPLSAMPAFRGLADWYYEWMKHPPGDGWWDWAELTDKYPRTSAAVLNLTGWHDEAYGPLGATTNFSGLLHARGGSAATARTRLVIGPWSHGVGPMARTKTGDRVMGPDAAIDYDALVLRWMDRWVKGEDNGVDREPPVHVFVMGENRWRDAQAWPLPRTEYRSLYLGGRMGEEAEGRRGGGLSSQPTKAGAVVMISDPAVPIRDAYAEEAGAHDYRALGEWPGVILFETQPLESDLAVVGPAEAEIYLSTDSPDTDLWVKLLDVAPDSTAFNLMSPGLDVLRASYRDGGPVRKLLEPGVVYRLRLRNLMTGNRFLKGHRIRIAVMTSFMPHMSRNLHSGQLETESAALRTARITIHFGGKHPSRIVVPVVK